MDRVTIQEWRGDMSRGELAELLGVSLSTLKRWEHGDSRVPHPVTLLTKLVKPGQLKGINP